MASLPPPGGQAMWSHGDAHGLALSVIRRAREGRALEDAERDFAVSGRFFRPYVYSGGEGAGTRLESALRKADSKVLVNRPRDPKELHEHCLKRFDGFRAGSGEITEWTTAEPPVVLENAEISAPTSSEGIFCVSTRPGMSGSS